MPMTNDEMNARAQAIADLVKRDAEAGETPDDLARMVFVNVKVLIVELTDGGKLS